MQVRSIHHVNIKVFDVDESIRFYTTVLGLGLRDDRPAVASPGAWLDAGTQQIHLSAGDVPGAKGQHFALEVDDLVAATAELERAGVPVRNPTPGAFTMVTLTDPSGNLVELRQA